jgi:outer membrane lipoprotein-sorting protein
MLNFLKVKKRLLLISLLVFSQGFAQYDIKKHTINNGGGKMTGGNYEMNSSIGQVDASSTQTGGNYSLNGGFWHKTDTTPQSELIFTNGFE